MTESATAMLMDVKTEIEKLIEPILNQEQFDLVEIKLSRYKRRYRLQVFADSDHGVTIDDCARLSQLIGTAIDLTDLFEAGYILEVSSPGLDRPLVGERDFRRKIGEEMEIQVEQDGRVSEVRGTLTGVENGTLLLSNTNGAVEIALSDVRQGRIIF